MSQDNSTLGLLDEQIRWYSQKSDSNQRWFKILKVLEVVVAAMIPFAAGLSPYIGRYAPSLIVTGALGVVIVILESVQGIFQFQSNWISFRSTREGLRREVHLWEAKAGPYAYTSEPDRLLAERTEALISTEHTRWISSLERADKVKAATQLPSQPEEKV